jgi:hypothetical protein
MDTTISLLILSIGVAMTTPAAAQETDSTENPEPSNERPPTERYDDETQLSRSIGVIARDTTARVAPYMTAASVAHLSIGTNVVRVAMRGNALLVELEDPDDPSATLTGWIPSMAWAATRRSMVVVTQAEQRADEHHERAPSTTWYGWQTLIADGMVIPLMLLPPVGISFYFFGAPAVHWAHGNVGVGFASLGIRLLAGGAVVGSSLIALIGAFDGKGEIAAIGVTLAIASALTPVVIDAALLGFDERNVKRSTRIFPSVSPTKDGATLGVLATW